MRSDGGTPTPSIALSIRQPWAWLIVNGHKDIENREWPTRFRGHFLVHAGKGMTRAEYEGAVDTIDYVGRKDIVLPPFEALERGGIVGEAEIVGCVLISESKWFFGRYGFQIAHGKPLPFRPCKGSLGFFKVAP